MLSSSFATNIVSNNNGDEDDHLIGYQISFSWDYPDDWCLKDVKDTVFHILDQRNQLRSESQFLSDSIQSSGSGVLLVPPSIRNDNVPSAIHFTSRTANNRYCITNIIVVSEAKHVELYIDGSYEKTSKGCMLTMKKGRKAALYENAIDMTDTMQSYQKITLKFLSLADRHSMRIQTVVVKVVEGNHGQAGMHAAPESKGMQGMDMNAVKDMISSIGQSVSGEAQKLMKEMEEKHKQQQLMSFQNMMQFGMMLNNPLLQMGKNIKQEEIPRRVSMYNNEDQTSESSKSLPAYVRPQQQNQEREPKRLFPMQRHDPVPMQQRRVRRHKSLCSVDQYDIYGAPNPPSESVLANAILNTEQAREASASRAELIANENYEQAQMEIVKNFLKSQDTTKLSITKLPFNRPPDKPPRVLNRSEKRRPHSIAALPTTSEMDFTTLLSDLINEEKEVKVTDDNQSIQSYAQSARWEAYLRSRVKASKRLSTSECSYDKDSEKTLRDGNVYDSSDSGGTFSPHSRICQECGRGDNDDMNQHIRNAIVSSEYRVMDNMEKKLQELKQHIDTRLDSMFDMILSPHPNYHDDLNDYSSGQDTTV